MSNCNFNIEVKEKECIHSDCNQSHNSSDLDKSEEDDSSTNSSDTEAKEDIYLDKMILNDWGSQYLLKQPWADQRKPTVRMIDYSKLKLTESEKEGILSDRIIASCSSYLDKTPYINKYAMCKCVLNNKGLKNIDILGYHHYLQYLDLSNNQLNSLKPLEQLPFLMYLDASSNLLTEILDFKAPYFLTYVNYSYNSITQIQDLSKFWSICIMDLSHNFIKKINGLQTLKYLRNLNLSYNQIERIENLNKMMNLQFLNLQNNRINKYEVGVLQSLNQLIALNLSYNQMDSLEFIYRVHSLQELNLTGNDISCLMQLNYLRSLLKLTKLYLKENPIASRSDYYKVCVDAVRNISFLDGCYISATEKVQIKLEFAEQSHFRTSILHSRLLSIEHLQSPFIGFHVIPVDQPPPAIIALVGTIASKKGELVREFCKENPKYTVVGVSHTTRPKTDRERDHEAYHFVTIDEFRDLLKQGKFLSVFEFLGNCYGFAESELEKVTNIPTKKVLVTHLSLEGALLLRNRGLNPTLVLAMPLDAANHLDFLRYKYYQTFWDPNYSSILKIINCPEKAEFAREQEEKLDHLFKTKVCKNIIDEIVNELPEKPEDSKSTHTHEDNKRYSISGKYPTTSKGFNVTFQSQSNTTSEENDYNIHASSSENVSELLSEFKEFEVVDNVAESISKTIVDDDYNFLSVLSKVDFNADNIVDERENVAQIAVKLDEMKKYFSYLDIFYHRVLWYREFYFEQHIENPGLFAGVVFTDDFSTCLEKLKVHLKNCIEIKSKLCPVVKLKEDDPTYQNIISERLRCLHTAIKRTAATKYDLMQELEAELEASKVAEYTRNKVIY